MSVDIQHASDCAVHDAPAFAAGKCTCGAGLDDDQIEHMIEEPLNIETRSQAHQLIAILDEEIASIQAQIDAAMLRAAVRPPNEEEEGWLRRASYAKSMKLKDRDRIYRRERELRGIKSAVEGPAKAEKRALAQTKNERLRAEAEARKATHLAKIEAERTRQMELAEQRRQRKFVNSALARLAEDMATALLECSAGYVFAYVKLGDMKTFTWAEHGEQLASEFNRRQHVAKEALAAYRAAFPKEPK